MADTRLPFYAKVTIIHFGLMLLVITLYYAQDILTPFLFATLLAILLNPFALFLESKKIPRVIAIGLTVFLLIVIIALFFYFLTTQLGEFADAVPTLKQKINETLAKLQSWLSHSYGISVKKQINFLNQMVSNAGTFLGQTISTLTGLVILVTLIPVYVFLVLFYQNLFIGFLISVFSNSDPGRIKEILHESKVVIQSYIVGLLIEGAIVAILNSVGLLALGIDYAILLGVLGAVLNFVPYLGGLIAIALPVIIALVTKEEVSAAFGIVAVYAVIQFIDNNILVPRIVASKVRINALVSILAVLIGGAICGIAGMFLSIPVVAILKVIFDRIDSLKPWGMLIGDQIPVKQKFDLGLSKSHKVKVLKVSENVN